MVGLLLAGLLSIGPSAAAAATAQGAWSTSGRLTAGRADHTASRLENGKVLVAGGRSTVIEPAPGEPVDVTATAELYDPASGTWAPTGSMAAGRSGHTASVLAGPACGALPRPLWCGTVLVAGGRGAGGRPVAAAELYDPGSGTWRTLPPLATARADHTATVLQDGRVLVTGGRVLGGAQVVQGESSTDSTELYDPAIETWSPGGSLAVARYAHTATLLGGGGVLVAGGLETVFNDVLQEARDEPTRFAELFASSTGGWTPADPLGAERGHHSASLLADGRILVAGGIDADLNMRRSAELFGPATAWTPAASMGAGHSEHAASLLADGRLLVVGGGNGLREDTRLAEVYDPAANTWTYSGPVRLARRQHTATLLSGPGCEPSCGRVLVIGGALTDRRNNPSTPALASTELWDPAATARVLPGPIGEPRARATSGTAIVLSFSAAGVNEGSPPPARAYVVKQSRNRIASQRSFDRARSLCGGVCRFTPARVGDRLSLRVTALRPGTSYHFAVRASDSAGDLGPRSADVDARTRRDATPPARVIGLRAQALSATRIRLSFRAAGSDGMRPPPARRYFVKQSRSPVTTARRFRRARSLCGGVCRFSPRRVRDVLRLTVTRLAPNTTYHFSVAAGDAAGNLGPRSRSEPARTRRSGGSRSGR